MAEVSERQRRAANQVRASADELSRAIELAESEGLRVEVSIQKIDISTQGSGRRFWQRVNADVSLHIEV